MKNYQALRDIVYTFDRYGSLDGLEKQMSAFPLIQKAWDDYKLRRETLKALMRDAEAQTPYEEDE